MIDYTVKPSMHNRWAEFLDRLSQGLGMIAQMHQKREEEEMHENRLDARTAAQQAATANLARFTNAEEAKRQAAALAAGKENAQAEIGSREKLSGQEISSREKLELARIAQEKAYQTASLGIQGGQLANEKERTRLEDERDKARAKHDAEAKDRTDALTALGSVNTEQKTLLAEYNDLQKETSDIGKSGMAQAASGRIRAEMKGQPEDVIQQRLAQTPGTTEYNHAQLDSIKGKLDSLALDAQKLRAGAGYPSSSAGAAAGSASAKLSPDRQMIFDAARAAHPDQDPNELLQRVQSLPQSQVDQAIRSRPSADTTDPSQVGADSTADLYMQQPSPADNFGGQQPPQQAPDQSATMDQQGGQQPTPQTSEDQIAESDQYAQMRDQLDQSPEGQGVHTTLDRLAQADNSVQADKLHRQAELDLSNQFPDQDPNGYIDWYLQQQQQEPAYT